MSAPPTVRLAAVAYVWGAAHQDRLLLEQLGPAAGELRREGLLHGFFWDRYDARGPHLFAVLTIPEAAAPDVSGRLAARLAGHLADHPSPVELTPEQLARRHAETLGRRQCEADGRPGFAANNTFEILEHPPRGYPFRLSEGLAGEEELWRLAADLMLWTIGELAPRPGAPAAAAARRWTASVDRELRLAGVRTAEYWRYHAATLIPALAGMGPEEEAAALAGMAARVGDRGGDLASAWREVAAAGPVWPGLPRLVRLALGVGVWDLLREIDHATLKQLGLPVAFHIPQVLHAWRQG
ncbi:MAG TPA: hypothetical protein VGP73_26175 [Thermoanaerobaculia bacterium]